MARICVIRQGYISLDPRVRSEVEALVAAGHEVDVICLRLRGEPRYQRDGRLTVRRLTIPHNRSGWTGYLFQYAAFLIAAGFLVSLRHLRHRYELIQINTMPDSLVFSALVPRLLGAKVLVDLHECMPEFFSAKFKIGLRHPVVRLVVCAEQAAIRFADFATTCTEPMRQAFIARGAPATKMEVVLGSFGLNLDSARVRAPIRPGSQRFVLISHGTIEERYGLDTLVRAVALLKEEIPDLCLAIVGEGSYRPALVSLVRELDLGQRVSFTNGWVPMEELLQAIAAADVGVVALKRDPYRDMTLCTKMFDYIGLRKPAIVSRTATVEELFDHSCFQMFTGGDEKDLARAIREVHADPDLRRALVDRAAVVAEQYSWTVQRERYLQVVNVLIRAPRRAMKPDPLLANKVRIGPHG